MKRNRIFMVVLSLLLTTSAGLAAAEPLRAASRWLAGLPSLTEPRQEVAVAELGGKIYVAGGVRGDGTPVNTMEFYDPRIGRWTATTSVPATGGNMALVAYNGKLYAMGGLPAISNVHVFDPESRQWEALSDMPTPRGGFGAAVIGTKIYTAGGVNSDGVMGALYVYDVTRGTWSQLSDMPTPRYNLAVAAIGGKLYTVGGRADGDLTLGMVEVYDPETDTWSIPGAMPTGRSDMASAVFDNELYIMGGEGNRAHPSGVYAVTEIYNPQQNQWRTGPPMPTPRHGTGAALINNSIYVPGGAQGQGIEISRVTEVLLGSVEALFLPHVPVGNGMSTEITLTNFSTDLPASGVMEFFAPSGEPTTLNINGRLLGSVPLAIAPHGSATFTAEAGLTDPLRVVYAAVFTDYPLNGGVIFRSGPSVAGVAAGRLFRRFLLPVQVNESRQTNTGLALLNPGADAATVTLTLNKEDGTELASTSVSLQAARQFSRFITEFFPEVNFSNFRGTIVGSSSKAIAGVTILVTGTQLTSIPLTGE